MWGGLSGRSRLFSRLLRRRAEAQMQARKPAPRAEMDHRNSENGLGGRSVQHPLDRIGEYFRQEWLLKKLDTRGARLVWIPAGDDRAELRIALPQPGEQFFAIHPGKRQIGDQKSMPTRIGVEQADCRVGVRTGL